MYKANLYDENMKFVSKRNWDDVDISEWSKVNNLLTGKLQNNKNIYYVFADILPHADLELLPK